MDEWRLRIVDFQEVDGEATVVTGMDGNKLLRAVLLKS